MTFSLHRSNVYHTNPESKNYLTFLIFWKTDDSSGRLWENKVFRRAAKIYPIATSRNKN
jgi:secreted protein with Ig-like and vWFA domain